MTKQIYRVILVLTLLIAAPLLADLIQRTSMAASSQEPKSSEQTDREKELKRASELNAQVFKLTGERRYKEALPIAQQVAEIRERFLSPGDPLLGFALNNLGDIYLGAKKEGEAEKALQRALVVYEVHPEQNALAMSRILESLGYIRFLKRDYNKADSLYLRALALKEKEFGPSNQTTIAALKNYACLNLIANAKGEQPREPSDEDGRLLRARGWCWLSGFIDNCASMGGIKSEGVVNGKAIRLATPTYPEAALKKHLSGTVFIAIAIDESGNVTDAKAVCGGAPELNAAAVAAARQSKFTGTRIDNQPVKVNGVIFYNFVGRR